MSIIKVIDGEKRVVADISIKDHNQLTGREAYGAHPISAIRKLPEKLHELKEACQILDGKIAAHDGEVDTDLLNLRTELQQLTSEVHNAIENAKCISLVEDFDNKGKLIFFDYDGYTTSVQGGFLPDNTTLKLTEQDTLELKNKPDEQTIITDNGKIYATAIKDDSRIITPTTIIELEDNLNETLDTIAARVDALDLLIQESEISNEEQNDEIIKLKHITQGMGGYLDSYNFGANPTQEDLTAYALQDIGIENSLDIFNGTKVINLYNDHLWVLTNTPDSEPAVFSWQDLGQYTKESVATEDFYGLVKSSNEDLSGKVDLTGQITINGLQERLNNINNLINTIQSQYATKQYVEENGGKINSISLNGVKQQIDSNKNVDLQLDLSSVTTQVDQVGNDLNTLKNNIEKSLEIIDLTEV